MKQLFFWGLGGVYLALPVLLHAQEELDCNGWNCGIESASSAGLPDGYIYDIISATLTWLLAVLGFIAIAGFVISGLLYLTSAGNEGQAEQAKNAMKYSIIGVIVALMGYVMIMAIDSLLTGSSLF